MKIYLLSDDPDTVLGLRLAGVEGKVLTDTENALGEIEKICEDSEIGLLLITPEISKKLGDKLPELQKRHFPIITEIPDSNPENTSKAGVTDYIRNAVGI